MKRNFRLAALAVTAMALMAACNNSNTEEVVLDTLPAADTVIEEVVDTTVAEATAETAPAKAATKKNAKQDETQTTVKTTTIGSKKDVQTVSGELTKSEGNTVEKTAADTKKKVNPLGTGKKAASEQTFTKQ